jgi:hypothetical protein
MHHRSAVFLMGGLAAVLLADAEPASGQTAYAQLCADNTTFATSLYASILHRGPDPGGLQGWVNALNAGTPRPSVMSAFFNSQEYRNDGRNNGAFITDLYAGVLGRAPDAGGFSWWLNVANGGTSRPNIINGFVTSQELQNDLVVCNHPVPPSPGPGPECPHGQVACKGTCISAATQVCLNGTVCPAGDYLCGGACAQPASPCSSGLFCPTSMQECNGNTCISTTQSCASICAGAGCPSNPSTPPTISCAVNTFQCGGSCIPVDRPCAYTPQCSSGQTACGATCVASPVTCSGGVPTCPAGSTVCGTGCMPQSSSAYACLFAPGGRPADGAGPCLATQQYCGPSGSVASTSGCYAPGGVRTCALGQICAAGVGCPTSCPQNGTTAEFACGLTSCLPIGETCWTTPVCGAGQIASNGVNGATCTMAPAPAVVRKNEGIVVRVR